MGFFSVCPGWLNFMLWYAFFFSPCEGRFPINFGITGYVASTGKVRTKYHTRNNRFLCRNVGIASYPLFCSQTLNIPDAYADPRFDPSVVYRFPRFETFFYFFCGNWIIILPISSSQVDMGSAIKTKSILCMPIKNSANELIGVSQLINKLNGSSFNRNDENLFEVSFFSPSILKFKECKWVVYRFRT